jgi:hypothetical protein
MWWLGRSLLRSVPRARQPAPRPPGRPGSGGGIVIFVLLFPVMTAILLSGYRGHVSGKAVVAYVTAFLVLLPVAAVIGHAAEHSRKTHRVPRLAYPDRPRAPSADAMRKLAAQLRVQEAAEQAPVREQRVADLFSVPCPELLCEAPETVSCVLRPGLALVVVRKDPLALCHLERMGAAVRYGSATADDILAQFGNNVPEGAA